MNLSRAEIERIGEAVNKPASTIYRWRKDNPALFEAAYDYASKRGLVTPSGDQVERAYQEGMQASGCAGVSDCPYVTSSMTERDHALSDAWIAGLNDADSAMHDRYIERAKTVVDSQAHQFGKQPQAFFDGMTSAIARRLKIMDGIGLILEPYPETAGQDGWDDGLRVGSGIKLSEGVSQ